MIYSLLYFILAALGLGFLVFIHELGHYFMARRVGMTVEAFGIGFGKPLFTWEHKGVKWHVCILPFGGYVRIAGMDKKGGVEPYQVPDGFFGKSPKARIKVSVMGPAVNIGFAFLAFIVIWACGGRQKPFSEFTHIVGWVDPQSQLYAEGIRPGSEIHECNGKPFDGFKSLLYAAFLDGNTLVLKGFKINSDSGAKEPFTFTYNGKPGDNPLYLLGQIGPANYLLTDGLMEDSPMEDTGIQPDDRIVWVDGTAVYSLRQLTALINEQKALLTIQRGDQTFLTRVPRLAISDLRLSPTQKAELDDWQHLAGLKTKVSQLFFIPYNLTSDAVVEYPLTFIDETAREAVPTQTSGQASGTPLDASLQAGDKIVAVDGISIASSAQLLAQVQSRHIQVIAQREKAVPVLSWKEEDSFFSSSYKSEDLNALVASIGTGKNLSQQGNLILFPPVVPQPLDDYPLTSEQQAWRAKQKNVQKKQIAKIENTEKKKMALARLEARHKKLTLGLYQEELKVAYNPSPFTLFGDVWDETWYTLKALVVGHLNPKYMMGPVGIVQTMQHGWSLGFKEALYWMAIISFNLGILNLLPIPVLDGGHICFSLYEAITHRRIKAKTMERLIVPFIFLLIAFFVYVTYQDLVRIFSNLF